MIKMQNVRKTYPGFDFELSLEIPEESPDSSEKTEQERARRSA